MVTKEKLTFEVESCNVSDTKANRAQCSSTAHGSNPTLESAVNGLPNSINQRSVFVSRDSSSGPPDSNVGVGAFDLSLVYQILIDHYLKKAS